MEQTRLIYLFSKYFEDKMEMGIRKWNFRKFEKKKKKKKTWYFVFS